MHDGQGSYKDLLFLIELAQKKVKEKFWIDLINEVRIITNK
jgi:UDP-N-acetylenolpyruvoylglucosamine reductase